jgi:hypothetical protein
MKRPSILGLLAASVLLASKTPARGEAIFFSTNVSVRPYAVTSDDGALGTVRFSSDWTYERLGFAWSVPVDLYASAQNVGKLATFTNREYNVTLHITDKLSHASGDLTFTVALNGTAYSNIPPITEHSYSAFFLHDWNNSHSHYNLTNTILGPKTQSITLGGNQYTASLVTFTPIPLDESSTYRVGELTAYVTMTPGASFFNTLNALPEPGSLILAGIGASVVGLRARLRKRKA